ncbi:MAG: hypothetical protein M3N95_04850 [Actinomycetota bacterium]|nr:hypothetical protein [Actinomycetota bacterium]
MPARTPEERALIARIANATRLAKTPDRRSLTANARNGLRAKFEREALAACPNAAGDELERRIDDLQRAHMLRMSLKARQNRRKAQEHTRAAEVAERELRSLGAGAA